MRLVHRASEDMTFADRSWRTAPGGEILDQFGGLIAGDSRTRLQSLTMHTAGTDRFEYVAACEGNFGAECQRRWAGARKRQEEHARIFQ
jgi:hypothetical protein